MDHNPNECQVCQAYGDWGTTCDTAEWLEKHAEADIDIRVDGTRVIES